MIVIYLVDECEGGLGDKKTEHTGRKTEHTGRWAGYPIISDARGAGRLGTPRSSSFIPLGFVLRRALVLLLQIRIVGARLRMLNILVLFGFVGIRGGRFGRVLRFEIGALFSGVLLRNVVLFL
jgi:hypothetical protein